jgi:hypothetical protein
MQILDYARPEAGDNRAGLVRIGGALGVAACLIGFAIFLSACAGLNAVFMFSPVPAAFGGVGLVLTIVGGAFNSRLTVQDTPVLAALLVNVIALIGSLLLLAVWLDFPLFARPAAM